MSVEVFQNTGNFKLAFVFAVYSLLGEYRLSYYLVLNLCVQLYIGLTLPLSVYNIP